MSQPFTIRDCALVALAEGTKVQTLRELRLRLEYVHQGCIYYHFWGGLLYPRFDDPEFQNDFASWAYHSLHDLRTAERLGVISPAEIPDLEELRRELINVIDLCLDESDFVPWSRAGDQFQFVRSKIVVFDTGIRVTDPAALTSLISQLPSSAIFYHFIDARRRTPGRRDDFSTWLEGFGDRHAALSRSISEIDPWFTSLADLRVQLEAEFKKHFSFGA